MNRRIAVLILGIFLFTACTPKTIEVIKTIEVPVEKTVIVEMTSIVTIEVIKTVQVYETVTESSSLEILIVPTISPTSISINWNEAKNYIGEKQTVCGPVVDTKYASSSNEQPTFLNVGLGYPDPERLIILIWGNNRNKFPTNPEEFYDGKNICVTGEIQTYQGSIQMVVEDPSQIDIQ